MSAPFVVERKKRVDVFSERNVLTKLLSNELRELTNRIIGIQTGTFDVFLTVQIFIGMRYFIFGTVFSSSFGPSGNEKSSH